MWAHKHARHVGTGARKHASHVGTWALKARNLADSIFLNVLSPVFTVSLPVVFTAIDDRAKKGCARPLIS